MDEKQESEMLRLLREKYLELEQEEKGLQLRWRQIDCERKELRLMMRPYEEILEFHNVLLNDEPGNKWYRIWLEKWGQVPLSS